MNRGIHWRRYRTRGLFRYWDKEFTLLGEEYSKERVEPWRRWWRRLAAEIAAALRLRETPHRIYAVIDDNAAVRRVG
ncbi:hypothetical protein [Mycolicibacterium mucogenicum]|uniref:hypothetical protein n=1 Tax=Mycolicibacterium mucogenicum TaxID=56689 RepID=UPI000769DDD4|nr:hypothetical protein [Mycolicibacterium mucogenicum]